jgi:hypothetical protein
MATLPLLSLLRCLYFLPLFTLFIQNHNFSLPSFSGVKLLSGGLEQVSEPKLVGHAQQHYFDSITAADSLSCAVMDTRGDILACFVMCAIYECHLKKKEKKNTTITTLLQSESRLSKICGILNISQPYRPPGPLMIALLYGGVCFLWGTNWTVSTTTSIQYLTVNCEPIV